jgi:hypothetical protein
MGERRRCGFPFDRTGVLGVLKHVPFHLLQRLGDPLPHRAGDDGEFDDPRGTGGIRLPYARLEVLQNARPFVVQEIERHEDALPHGQRLLEKGHADLIVVFARGRHEENHVGHRRQAKRPRLIPLPIRIDIGGIDHGEIPPNLLLMKVKKRVQFPPPRLGIQSVAFLQDLLRRTRKEMGRCQAGVL